MRTKTLALVLPVAILVLALQGVASAASFTVLHSFGGPEGETPAAPLVQGATASSTGSRPTAATSRSSSGRHRHGIPHGRKRQRQDAARVSRPRGRASEQPDPGPRRVVLRHRHPRRADRDLVAPAGVRDDLPHGRGRCRDCAARLPGQRHRGLPRTRSSRAPTGLSTERLGRSRAARAFAGIRLPPRPGDGRLPTLA